MTLLRILLIFAYYMRSKLSQSKKIDFFKFSYEMKYNKNRNYLRYNIIKKICFIQSYNSIYSKSYDAQNFLFEFVVFDQAHCLSSC